MAAALPQRRWIGYCNKTGLGPGLKFRLTRAYAEGRARGIAGGAATDNPEDGLGTPREKAWDEGFDNILEATYQFETQA